MHKHPSHYKGLTRPIDTTITVDGRFNPYELDQDYVYVVCACQHDKFRVLVSGYPEVKVICTKCEKEYLVYDVDYYPTTCGYDPEKGNLKMFKSESGNEIFQVIAGWLYPEEPEEDEDENCLDWFILVVKDPESGEYIEVVNDESA